MWRRPPRPSRLGKIRRIVPNTPACPAGDTARHSLVARRNTVGHLKILLSRNLKELPIAFQGGTGDCDNYWTCSCANRDCGRYFRAGYNREGCLSTVERDACRADKIVSQDDHRRSYRARVGDSFDERLESYGKFEGGPIVASATAKSSAIEIAVGGLDDSLWENAVRTSLTTLFRRTCTA
jgi:hypothetical protein